MNKPICEIKNLCIDYPISIGTVRAVEDASLNLYSGKTLGLVGESGCGKSTLGLSLLRLARPPGRIREGKILFHGKDILSIKDREVLKLREGEGGTIKMAFNSYETAAAAAEVLNKNGFSAWERK